MRLIPGLALAVLLTGSGAHAGPVPLKPEDLFRMQWANDPQISWDGTQIAYARTANDIMTDRQSQSLWLIDTATGAQTPLAVGEGVNSSPRWSEDGSRIAYLHSGTDGRTQIMLRWLNGGADAAPLSQLTEAPSDISWSPDGKEIAFIMFTPESAPSPTLGRALQKPEGATWKESPVVVNTLNFRADGKGMDRQGYRHLFVMHVDGAGSPRQLTSGPFSDVGPLAWSPDGKSIYFATNRDPDWAREPADMILSIYKINVADGALKQLSHEVGPYHAPAVSPDGKQIAFLGFQDKHIGFQNVRLNLMDADGGHARVIGESFDRALADFVWAADGKSLYVSYTDEGVTKVARMSLSGQIEPVASGLAHVFGTVQLPVSGGDFTVSAKGAVAYTGGGGDHLSEVFLARNGKSQRLTDLNAELFKDVQIGALSALPVKSSADGRTIGAWELLPPNFDPSKKYPLILEIHGGPYESYSPNFSADFQFYGAAGYIVVYGNPRGSTSYGEEFANTIYNNYPSQDYDDLMSIVDAAIKNGNVDPDNLFITGWSGGGVLSSWIIGKTNRFRAAVVQRPVVNWTSWLLTTDLSAFGARYWFKKFPWEDQETYWKHSSISLVGNVTTPTLVTVGTNDLRTPVGEAEQFYLALQLRHVPTTLLYVPGATHTILTPSQLAEQITAIVEWFDRYRKR